MPLRGQDGAIFVEVGDVIDLTGAESAQRRTGEVNLRVVLRPKTGNNVMQVFVRGEGVNLKVGRVTKILSVSHYPRMLDNGRWFNNTDCIVELENAFGERPTLYAENSPYTRRQTRAKPKGLNTSPTFTYGAENAKKEEN